MLVIRAPVDSADDADSASATEAKGTGSHLGIQLHREGLICDFLALNSKWSSLRNEPQVVEANL